MNGAATTLAALIDATPEPPDDVEPDELVSAGADLVRGRHQPFIALEALIADDPGAIERDPRARELLAEINRRDAAWSLALEAARQELERRVAGVRRLRQRRR